jgi:two-component system alkaline phosphatase synthesis response regulator PhoP
MSSTMPATRHILVVEDEEHLAHGIKFNFEAEGYQVTTVADGRTALRLIEEDRGAIDLVILDLMLPGMSGYAVCEALRAAGNEVPILMLTARTLTEDRVRGYNSGADQYLVKPFELEELLSIVRNLLARRVRRPPGEKRGSEIGDTFEFGTAKVNFATFEATVEGRPLRLTNIEMSLLRYFAENEGRVIDRNELLENVWGHTTSPTTRTVDNFIVRLRKYFEPDPSRPRHFLSVRGAGYRFVTSGESDGAAAGESDGAAPA